MAPYGPTQQAAIASYFTPRGPDGRPLPFRLPRNAGMGIKLPKIGGMRLRRNVTTGKYGKRDVIVDANGKVYGFAQPGRFQIGAGNDAGYISLAPKPKGGRGGRPGGRPGGGTGGAAGATGGATTGGVKPDEYASYEKDYPWIAKYLRSLRDEESAFNTRYTTQIQPGVSAGLEALGKIGQGIANTYASQVGTPNAPGYVTNIYGTAANMAPSQVASGLGGATSTYDPNAVASRQGLSSASAAGASADARYKSLMAGLSPVSTAQGILGNVASQYATISKTYADKRLSERVKLDQWIAEQKASAEDRQIRQQYNMALLNVKQDQVALDQQKLDRQGQKTNAELAADGFRRVSDVAKAGPKWKDKISGSTVTSVEGEQWYKPKSGKSSGSGSGSGSGAPTANQQLDFQNGLLEAYNGKEATPDPKTGVLGSKTPGYRDRKGWSTQADGVAAYFLAPAGIGFKAANPQQVRDIIKRSIGTFYGTSDGIQYKPYNAALNKKIVDRVIAILQSRGYFG